MEKSYIWSLPTRIFHFLFAAFILFAFLTDDDKLLNYHAMIGYSILILLVFRLGWGFFGPKYSLFKDFPANKNEAKEFLKNIFDDKQKYIGHNPLASYVMIAMLVVTFLAIITGVLAYGIQEGKGILSFLNNSFSKDMEFFEEVHEFFANSLIALIVAHLAGIAVDRLLHNKHETLNSIVTGYKMTTSSESIKLTFLQKLFAIFMLLVFVSFLAFNIYKPNNPFVASKYEAIDYKVENVAFVNECASCHTPYPTKPIA